MPDFANASSVQGLGQMVAEYFTLVDSRLSALEGNVASAPEEPVAQPEAESTPAPEEPVV